MATLRHVAPETVEETCSLLAEYGDDAAVLSGGQSLLPTIRRRTASYDVLVDIDRLDGRSFLERDGDQLRIGCLVRHADVADSKLVRETVPALADLAGSIGDVQVRNRGTLCGAVAHGDPAGDPPVLTALLDADVVAASADGTRVLDGRSFYAGDRRTALETDELVTEVRFPIPDDGTGVAYEKWTPSGESYPVATVGALVELDGETVSGAALTTGALESEPTPMDEAADVLVGETPTDEVLDRAARTLGENASPREDHEGSAAFKSELATTVARDALGDAVARAREEQ